MTHGRRKSRRCGEITKMLALIACAAALASCGPKRHIVGSVNTEFNLIGPDHKIIIESYDDPKIDGTTIFISKSQTGGIKGALGLAEDTSDASRSGLAILNSAISGNSGQQGWPRKAGQQGVFDGQEIRAADAPHAHF